MKNAGGMQYPEAAGQPVGVASQISFSGDGFPSGGGGSYSRLRGDEFLDSGMFFSEGESKGSSCVPGQV